jgi:hypothetical protein
LLGASVLALFVDYSGDWIADNRVLGIVVDAGTGGGWIFDADGNSGGG